MPSVLRYIFTEYRIVSWQIFTLNTLNVSLHYLSSLIFSWKKSAIILIFVPFFVFSLFFSCLQGSLLSLDFQRFAFDIYRCFILYGVLRAHTSVVHYCYINFEKFSVILYSNIYSAYFYLVPPGTPIIYMFRPLVIDLSSWMLCWCFLAL